MHPYQRSAVQWMLDRELASETERLRIQKRFRSQQQDADERSASHADDPGNDVEVQISPLLSSFSSLGHLDGGWLDRLVTETKARYGPVLKLLGAGVGLLPLPDTVAQTGSASRPGSGDAPLVPENAAAATTKQAATAKVPARAKAPLAQRMGTRRALGAVIQRTGDGHPAVAATEHSAEQKAVDVTSTRAHAERRAALLVESRFFPRLRRRSCLLDSASKDTRVLPAAAVDQETHP